MRTKFGRHLVVRSTATALLLVGLGGCSSDEAPDSTQIAEGKQTFRYDTFGDETKWTDALRLNEAIATVDPTTALQVGLKVDAEALPRQS